jgi:hypothetical protein
MIIDEGVYRPVIPAPAPTANAWNPTSRNSNRPGTIGMPLALALSTLNNEGHPFNFKAKVPIEVVRQRGGIRGCISFQSS